jgi:hypothetical protein
MAISRYYIGGFWWLFYCGYFIVAIGAYSINGYLTRSQAPR